MKVAGSKLAGAYLAGADLQDARLAKTTLRQLRGAKLARADLRNADLIVSCLEGADLTGANLENAELGSAILNDAVLRDANLAGADLDAAILKDADLRGARGLTQAQLDEALGGDARTQLPRGLKLHGFAAAKRDREAAWLLHYPARRDRFVTDEARTFLRHNMGAIYDYLRPRAWPPTGWAGAQNDARLATELAAMLAGRQESGDASSPFFPFVSPPGSPTDQFCTAGPLTTRDQPPNRDPKLAFFFAGSSSEARAFGRGDGWWREFWDDETHGALAAAGAHMGTKLRKVARQEHCVGYVSWIVFHSGRSPSGADVGVLSTMTIGR